MVCTVKHIHALHIVHRDLKPSNILINVAARRISIGDFDSARFCFSDPRHHPLRQPTSSSSSTGEGDDQYYMTEYVTTRWYRSPEVICGHPGRYKFPMDIWSLGCIFGEMIKGSALFPGETSRSQLLEIFKVLGKPDESEWKTFSNDSKEWNALYESCKDGKESKLSSVLPSSTPDDQLDLLRRMLTLDPEKRITIDQILVRFVV
jgi:mitogen-activated protein kinase 1/3